MSDTCIVCLGDLVTENPEDAATASSSAKSPLHENVSSPAIDARPPTTTDNKNNDSTLIAHLQPCGHDLHNECLTPWVERANSCPICRQSFHLVELLHAVGGDVISSYTVQDRTQVADLDPSMFLEVPDDEDEDQPCQACGEDDNEDVLMYCDSCQKLWHTYCVDLQEVPFGSWFCDNCRAQRDVDPRQVGQRQPQRQSRRRTRGQQRRHRGQQVAHDSGWNQVWQSVWDRIQIDLDDPYDDDETTATLMRRHRQSNESNRQAHEAWRRRMQVAELHGAGGRFRETEPALLETHSVPMPPVRRPSPAVQAQSSDEMMAWHAFDQARAADADPSSSRKKKRKSRTASPTERESDGGSEVAKKRRVSEDRSRSASTNVGVASRLQPLERHPSPLSRPALLSIDTNGPSFLQSLLQEVESLSSTHNVTVNRPQGRNAASPPAEHQSPRPSSPALSPLPSNHSSPRAMSATPPPLALPRPSSPTGLTSSIQPVFPLAEYSPSRASPEPRDCSSDSAPESNGRSRRRVRLSARLQPRSRVPPMMDQSPPSRTRSNETSPTRATMSLSAKSDVQKLVAAALKPLYADQTISKDEYIAINKNTSRMLYDKIGEDIEALGVEGKARWEKVAAEEVNKAVGALKGRSIPVASS